MDQFDEFEFKPLTKGLGFHQKTVNLSNEIKSSGVASQSLFEKNIPGVPARSEARDKAAADAVSRLISSIPTVGGAPRENASPLNSATMMQPALPRENAAAPEPTLRSPKYSTLSNQNSNFGSTQLDFVEPTRNRISAEPLATVLKEKPFSIGAFIFDGLVVAGLSSLFTGVVLAVTDVGLEAVIESAQTDAWTMASLVLLVLSVVQLYLILARSFFGATLGEWALDLSMGSPRQHQSAWFPIAIAWRSLLVMITGFVTLPVLSLLFRRDLAGWVSGVKLYRKS